MADAVTDFLNFVKATQPTTSTTTGSGGTSTSTTSTAYDPTQLQNLINNQLKNDPNFIKLLNSANAAGGYASGTSSKAAQDYAAKVTANVMAQQGVGKVVTQTTNNPQTTSVQKASPGAGGLANPMLLASGLLAANGLVKAMTETRDAKGNVVGAGSNPLGAGYDFLKRKATDLFSSDNPNAPASSAPTGSVADSNVANAIDGVASTPQQPTYSGVYTQADTYDIGTSSQQQSQPTYTPDFGDGGSIVGGGGSDDSYWYWSDSGN